jgi:tetratricopeptide (TPR) repeat protein
LSKHQALGLPDPAKAMQHLEQAAALAPEEPENHLRMGQIYLDSGQVAKAVPALEQAVHLKPDCGEGWLALAQAQAAVGQWDPAAQSAEKAANFASDPSEALLLRGRIAMHSKNPRGALSRAQAVLRLQPDHSGALYLLSQALEALERPKDALKALERALPHSPDPLALQIERVHLLRRADGLEAALPALQDLAQKNPRRPDISALLANWLLEAGQNEPAVAMARQALQEGKDSLPADQRAALHTLIGLQMRLSGQLDQAIQQLSEAAALAPANLEVLLELGRAYQERREYKPALKVFQKAMGVAGGDYRPYYQAGLVLKDSKDYMAAEAMLRRAAQLAPNEVSIHRLLGAVVALNLVHSNKL